MEEAPAFEKNSKREQLRHVMLLFTFPCLKEHEIMKSPFLLDHYKREYFAFSFSVLPAREESYDLRAEVHWEKKY